MKKALTKYNVCELVKLGVKNYQVPHSSLLTERTGYGDLATPMVKDEGIQASLRIVDVCLVHHGFIQILCKLLSRELFA